MSAAVWLSVQVAIASVVFGAPFAIALGWVLARSRMPGKWLLSAVVAAPMVVPPVVTGLALLELFGRGGPLAPVAAALGVDVAFGRAGAVLAAFLVGLPFFVLAVRGALFAVDRRLTDVALTLGVAPGAAALRITLPLALPGIAAGAVLAFARALGEFGATVVIAGNIEGRTRTMAVAVYTLIDSPAGMADARLLALISVGISVGALIAYEALARWQASRLEVYAGD